MSEENTSLVPLTKENAVDYFKPDGLDPILKSIKEQASKLKPDTSTDAGRKEISSNARKVASAKVALDNIRKELVSGEKARLKAIDAEGGRAWDELELLQKQVRKPLDDWEALDEKRTEAHKLALDHINSLHAAETVEGLDMALHLLEKYRFKDFEEFAELAQMSIDSAHSQITKKRDDLIKREEERAELEKLRKEAEDRKKKDVEEQALRDEEQRKKEQADREEKIKQEASANAERIANEKAERDRQETARKAQEEIDKAKREKEDADRRAAQAEADRIAAEKKAREDAEAAKVQAENNRIAHEVQAKREQEAAVQAERDRQEKIRQDEAIATAKREADTKHRKTVNNEAKAAIKKAGAILDADERAEAIVRAIVEGKIPHVKISY